MVNLKKDLVIKHIITVFRDTVNTPPDMIILNLVESQIKEWGGSPEQPYIPSFPVGCYRRPWEAPEGLKNRVETSWYFEGNTPEAIGSSLLKMAQWMVANQGRVTKDRLAVIYAWNEIGEGGWVVPCIDNPGGTRPKAIRRIVTGK
jgi:hypothetical protein